MCDECTWHHETFLVQSVYWHLAISVIVYCIVLYWSQSWHAVSLPLSCEEITACSHTRRCRGDGDGSDGGSSRSSSSSSSVISSSNCVHFCRWWTQATMGILTESKQFTPRGLLLKLLSLITTLLLLRLNLKKSFLFLVFKCITLHLRLLVRIHKPRVRGFLFLFL